MGSLIVGFYWLLYTPFAGFMAQKDKDIQIFTADAHRDGEKKGLSFGRLHITAQVLL